MSSAIGLTTDLAGGASDRFRSLPMARMVVLAGRIVGDVLRNSVVVVLMVAVGVWSGSASTYGVARGRRRRVRLHALLGCSSAMRALTQGGDLEHALTMALLRIAGLTAVCSPRWRCVRY